MFADWTRHITDPEEKARFESSVLGSKTVLRRLTDLMNEREFSIDVGERGLKQFDNPSWAYKQAFNNGFRSCLETVKLLIDLDKQVTKEIN